MKWQFVLGLLLCVALVASVSGEELPVETLKALEALSNPVESSRMQHEEKAILIKKAVYKPNYYKD
ncbi:hypothetical protein BOX15_Mlig020534g2 [Macrostomum lignano]|uniref:Uncharacterized protein n=1 Tax=Macrostomum lignano TaxID=282301 RepID=A0A267DRK4_9PLAT|nr:hypothetical protein BOX15_Mlig020534g2 [Macrostomum lignano]